MFKEIDREKALLLRKYLAKSARKLVERDFAKKRLEEQIKKLKKITSRDIRKEITELEARIAETLEREKKILQHHVEEDTFHLKLGGKIDLLEKKLARYIETGAARAQRVTALEEKITHRLASKGEKALLLRKRLAALENIYREARKEGLSPKKLDALKERIDTARKRIRAE